MDKFWNTLCKYFRSIAKIYSSRNIWDWSLPLLLHKEDVLEVREVREIWKLSKYDESRRARALSIESNVNKIDRNGRNGGGLSGGNFIMSHATSLIEYIVIDVRDNGQPKCPLYRRRNHLRDVTFSIARAVEVFQKRDREYHARG